MDVDAATRPDAPIRVSERISANLPQMSSAMTKIADVLLEDPTAPLELSITELAERAGASAATVTRFCRFLGFPGYVQFRVAVAADAGRDHGEHDGASLEIGRAFDPEDAPRELLRTLLNAHLRSLKATAQLVDIDQCAMVAREISERDHLDIYGTGGSAAMADEMQNRLYRIGINVHSWGDVHAGLASASIQDEGSVAIGISNSGRTKETIEMLAQARASGAFTVAITNRQNSPLGQLADVCLIASVPEEYLHPADLSAKHSQLFVLDLIYLLVLQHDYAETVRKLGATADAVAGHRRPDPAGRAELGSVR